MEKQTFNTDKKKITLYPALAENKPVIYLTTYNDDGGEVYAQIQKGSCPDFTLVTVSGLNWEAELSPWAAGNLFKYSEMFTGGADAYLQFLTQQVLPQAEAGLNGILWRGLAGYSLLWYPGFKDFAMQNTLCKTPQHLYFSLGDKEARARNQYLKTVQQCTGELAVHYHSLGINTFYELNPGGHYRNIISRSAAGIKWLLTQ